MTPAAAVAEQLATQLQVHFHCNSHVDLAYLLVHCNTKAHSRASVPPALPVPPALQLLLLEGHKPKGY